MRLLYKMTNVKKSSPKFAYFALGTYQTTSTAPWFHICEEIADISEITTRMMPVKKTLLLCRMLLRLALPKCIMMHIYCYIFVAIITHHGDLFIGDFIDC